MCQLHLLLIARRKCSFVESTAKAIAPHLQEGQLVVLESTTYPGTTDEVVRPILEQGSGLTAGKDFILLILLSGKTR